MWAARGNGEKEAISLTAKLMDSSISSPRWHVGRRARLGGDRAWLSVPRCRQFFIFECLHLLAGLYLRIFHRLRVVEDSARRFTKSISDVS
ncbi:hypothetical protein TNIN_385981 [Trichonephila inaurata madagascariensis]|uniref:Uncharacterized protein n=1 Tax=Trichonephila inaurata madagascariensis TaxID=2747483 RepID=A0A8X6XWT8_9ARAC|nr:hypothetical protein TNIN_385981 [Trichonephila inaurata madagascariensis]